MVILSGILEGQESDMAPRVASHAFADEHRLDGLIAIRLDPV